MNETSPCCEGSFDQARKDALFALWNLIQECHGTPDAEYPASKSQALDMIRRLDRSAREDEAKSIIRSDRAGALSLLCATLVKAISAGCGESLQSVSTPKTT